MKLPIQCPSCENKLIVSKLICENCLTEVSGKYSLPVLMQLNTEEQEFLIEFLISSGSLKEMANIMGKSYPTVRNKLDDIILKIKNIKENG